MSSHWTTGAFPRNTSNGDYGRFLFTNQSNSCMNNQHAQYSTDGNRMMQHVHYPNCPNRHSSMNVAAGNGSGMPQEYTVEYGEEAVRKALGGNFPDFQAQFQQQYGNGSGDGNTLQSVQMINNGKSKVTMIPVVLATDDGDDRVDSNNHPNGTAMNAQGNQNQSSSSSEMISSNENIGNESNISANTDAGADVGANQNADTNTAPSTEEQTSKAKAPKPENLLKAFDSVRKIRSTDQVKYGRHIRPSYYSPEIPNPCRKKMGECMPTAEDLAAQSSDLSNVNPMMVTPTSMTMNNETAGNMMIGNAGAYGGGYSNPQMMMDPNQGPPVECPAPAPKQQQRARSMPPKKPTFSLCGKCKKCKNLGSDETQTPVLTFPKYSHGLNQVMGNQQSMNPHQRQKLATSSQLGQSAKNFRAIRFSSHN